MNSTGPKPAHAQAKRAARAHFAGFTQRPLMVWITG
jgi:hypothetical protein